MSSLYVEFKRFYKKMTEKKPSTFDRECLCLSFTLALYVPFYTDSEYPISTALDCFFSTLLFLGWLRLVLFIDRWYLRQTIPYWRWNSIVLHIACCFAWSGRVVLEAESPGLIAAGEILGFTSVWLCYGILRFVVFLYKSFLARSFILAWLSFQIQRLISKKQAKS